MQNQRLIIESYTPIDVPQVSMESQCKVRIPSDEPTLGDAKIVYCWPWKTQTPGTDGARKGGDNVVSLS